MAKRVLLVDDDVDILESLALILEDSYEVRRAQNGLEALEEVERGDIDVVVLDLMMPVLDGEGFLHELKRRGLRVPVLVASAMGDLGRRCRELGVTDFVSKPFDVGQLEAKLSQLLA
jgi:DNA-binding response OmpR family regulator